ncbi:MAG: beta-mannosidase [Bacteroidales bacterium]|nr:beta-mannosidase [Bacteroidales bacterium]
MRKWMLILLAGVLSACGPRDKKPMETPKDELVHRLFTYAEEGKIAYGHQDDLFYGHNWVVTDYENDPLERSDVKDVTGKYPMLLGSDLGGIELGAEKNLDGIPFDLMRRAFLKHIERGGIVTFSWHPRNPLTGGDAWDISSDQVVKSILKGGEKEADFRLWLQRAADFIESIGPDVPVIFRPWHENIGSWFWWGGKLCTPQEYQELFRLTWLYFTKDRGLTNILWCYSPNGDVKPEEYMSRYPGDEFVDILGVDTYTSTWREDGVSFFKDDLRRIMNFLTALSYEHNKLMCLSETGYEGIKYPTWWTEILEPAVREYPISYLLIWRNAHDKPEHFYAAWKGFEYENDMKAFSELDNILFLD